MGSEASWEHWDTGLIPRPAQWVTYTLGPALLQLRLGSDPRARNSICLGVAKKERKKEKKKKKKKTGHGR